jgi:hypothetical protein
MRPAAPSSWVAAASPPAAAVDQPRASISHTTMNVQTVICGITNRDDAR